MALQDLFTRKELEKLLGRKERYQVLKNKNQIIISLLIYQGLTNGEVKQLVLGDIDLNQGLIQVKAGRKTNSRTLKLRSNQILLIDEYLKKDRPNLLGKSNLKTDKLLISKLGQAESGEGISYLIEMLKPLFPKRNLNAKTIRQSVIANLLKEGKDLRLVQVFAGHKYPSTTERYRQTEIEELKNQVLKYHPLQ